MAATARRTVLIAEGLELEVADVGAGEPVVLIQTALTGDELIPLTELLAQGTGLHATHLGRRGYGTSSPGRTGTAIADMAADCRDAMEALGVEPAHVVGASFSCVVALSLVVLAPSHVRSLTLVEPPPLDGTGAESFRAASARLVSIATTRGTAAALDDFMPMLYGPSWREDPQFASPGALAALERDAWTFFAVDLPAMLDHRIDDRDLAAVRCPVLVVGGEESGAWFREARELLGRRLPHAEEAVLAGADHLVATTRPRELAGHIVEFLRGERG